WPGGRQFQARKPGVKFAAFPGTDPPADKARARTLQIKELKDRFTARLGPGANNPGANKQGGAETRSMPKPLFEYADTESKLRLGDFFGMTATGTNPDLLLLIEGRRDGDGKLRWEYALARMTAEPAVVRLDGVEVWSEGASPANNTEPGNWIYYFLH